MAATGGNPTIDSLERVLTTQHGKDRYLTTLELAFEWVEFDNRKALGYATEANRQSASIGDSHEIVRSKRIMGQILRRAGHNREAIATFQEALGLAEKYNDEDEEMWICNSLGLAYVFAARYDSALSYYYRTLRMRTERKLQAPISMTLANIGLLYYKLGEYDESISFSERAVEIGLIPDVEVNVRIPIINLALGHIKKRRFEKGEELLEQWIEKYGSNSSQTEIMNWQFAKGYLLLNMGRAKEAKVYYERSLEIANEVKDGYYQVEASVGIAMCLMTGSDRQRAQELLIWCEKVADESGYDTSLEGVYERLITLHERKGNLATLVEWQSKLLSLRQRVMNENVLHRISVARVEFQERENTLLIKKQAEVIGLNNEVISRQRWLTILSFSLALVLVGFIALLYQFIRQQKRIALDLDRKVSERTRELQASEASLVRSLAEQRALMDLVSRKVRSSIATFRGLWQFAAADPVQRTIIIEKFERTASDLLEVSNIVDRSSELRSGQGEFDAGAAIA